MTDFQSLNLVPPLQQALQQAGYQTPTPIQAQAIPPLLEGRDLLGIAQTGTGKTAAFALPILDRLAREQRQPGPKGARALILTPTRELASQINASLTTYGKHLRISTTVIFGGVGQNPQVRAMSRGVGVLVATPGRLLDLINQGHVRLDRLEAFVLDEADRMLDMGFIHDVRKVMALLPAKRQTLLFSATMPKDIASLADTLLREPVRVEVTPQATTVERIDQKVLFVDKNNKRHLLRDIITQEPVERVLVFTRTKHGANRVAEDLGKSDIQAAAIHGNKSQGARERALGQFRSGQVKVLVATDIAARGIDVAGVSHVINFDLPNEPESYVHRIGRTARAGRDGSAISFCDAMERAFLRDIERLTRQQLPVDLEHPYHSEEALNAAPVKPPANNGGGRRGNGGGNRPAGNRQGQPRQEGAQNAPARNGNRRRRGATTTGAGRRSGGNGTARSAA